MMSEIKEQNILNVRFSYLQIGRLNNCQDISYFHLFYRFSAFLIKIPTSYFMDIDKSMPKFIQRDKNKQIKTKHTQKNT